MKNCDLGLENAALGLRPRAAFSRPRSQFFTIRTSQPANNIYLLYRHWCFTEKYTTRKIHKNYIRDPSGLFSIISHVSLSMISLISSLSLVIKFVGVSQGRGRKLMNFSYMHHPTKNDVTSGLNCDSRLVAQSEKMAFRLLKIPLYL